ncbi:MAG TPA: TauD/TfdA family dioxygenase [Rhodopila sp.]|nr:TauD/TfdA family dioxygenase [Rhodopila sp.]
MSAALQWNVEIRPLSPILAAEVLGLDLRRPLNAQTRDAVHEAFIRYHVLCFRNQDLSPEEQIAFTEQFGTLERHMARNKGKTNPLVHIVSNLDADGKPSGKVSSTGWHTDKSFRPEPSLATILHAVTMPPEGGETCFANMVAAYEALPEATRRALDDVKVVHSWALSRSNRDRKPTVEEIADAPDMIHPLVRTIPETGKKALFMGEHASHLDGGSIDEGRARILELEAHATQDRFVYLHRWREGDMLMWDNRCLLHRANANFDANRYPRVLHRTCLRGRAPA